LTGSPGFNQVARVNFFNQNDAVLVKKTKVLQPSFLPGLIGSTGSPGHTEFFLSLFFLQPGPVLAPGWPGPGSTYRTGFQNYATKNEKQKQKNSKHVYM
jgi:hypothetical protein